MQDKYMTPEEIATRINFPTSVEWSASYVSDYNNAIGAYQSLSPAEIKKWKKNPEGFIHEFDLSPGSDDDWDYVMPQYTYIYGRNILIVVDVSDLPSTNINKINKHEMIVESFSAIPSSGNARNKLLHFYDDLVGDALIDEVQGAWTNMAYGYRTAHEAYNNGKVSREFAAMAKGFSPADWKAVDFYVEALRTAN